MENREDVRETIKQELRRGILVLVVLGQMESPAYGYSLAQDLEEQGMVIDQSTLYPLLRRLEKQGLLTSDWSLDDSRPRKYYKITTFGQETLALLIQEWHNINLVVSRILEKGDVRDE